MCSNRVYYATTLAQADEEYLLAVHWGWDDAMRGRSWPRFYDGLSPMEQSAYEQGRLCAVNIRAAGHQFDWDGGREGAAIIERLHAMACYKVGSPFPVARVTA